MTGPYADASTLLPAAYNDLPGLDDGWETYHKRAEQTVTIVDEGVEVGDVTVLPGSVLRIFRQHDGRLYNSLTDVEITACGDDIEDLQAPVGSGETVYFEFDIYVKGSAEDFNFGVCIHTPPNPTGGFHVIGNSVLGTYAGGTFGADDFNNSSGVIMAGIPDQTLSSAVAAKVRGVLANGPQPGLLKLQLGPANESVSEGTWSTYGFKFDVVTTGLDLIDGSVVLVLGHTADAPAPAIGGTDVTIEELASYSLEWGPHSDPTDTTVERTKIWRVTANAVGAEFHRTTDGAYYGAVARWTASTDPPTSVDTQATVSIAWGGTDSTTAGGSVSATSLSLIIFGKTATLLDLTFLGDAAGYHTYPSPLLGDGSPHYLRYFAGAIAAYEVEGHIPALANRPEVADIYLASLILEPPP